MFDAAEMNAKYIEVAKIDVLIKYYKNHGDTTLEKEVRDIFLPSLRAVCAELDTTKFLFDDLRLSVNKFEGIVAQLERFILDNILAFSGSDTRLRSLNLVISSALNMFNKIRNCRADQYHS